MKKNNKNVGDARYTVNLISGAYTIPIDRETVLK